MKQHITKEQWGELSEELKMKLIEKIKPIVEHGRIFPYMNVGEMIEFLGDDLLSTKNYTESWEISLGSDIDFPEKSFLEDNLIDCLWEACKHRLNQ